MRDALLLLLLAGSLAACNGATGGAAGGDLDLEDAAVRGSYAQGLELGRRGQGLPIQAEAFVAGVRDGLAGEGRLDDEALQAALADFSRVMADAASAEAAANLAAGEKWLAENARREGVQVTESGLQYEVIEQGDGPRPQATDVVKVHYRGTLIDGTEFDSSYGREPVTFPLNGVIPGWTEGVQLMPVGAKYKLYIPGPLGYAESARPPIKPNDTLIFEVELLEIVESQ